MRFGSNMVVALLASLALLACKGPQKEAQAPEANPWADYKGTYAPGGPQDEAPAETKPKSIAKAEEPPAAAAPKPTKKSASAKPGKRGAAAPSATVAAAEPESGSDAKSMYGVESGAAADPDTPAPPPKKTAKKRGGAKKAHGKKKQAKK
jgi:hypothetical protein